MPKSRLTYQSVSTRGELTICRICSHIPTISSQERHVSRAVRMARNWNCHSTLRSILGMITGWEVSRQRVGNAFGVRYEGSTRAFYIELPYFSGTVQSRQRPKKSATKPATLPCCRLTSQTVYSSCPICSAVPCARSAGLPPAAAEA